VALSANEWKKSKQNRDIPAAEAISAIPINKDGRFNEIGRIRIEAEEYLKVDLDGPAAKKHIKRGKKN
jgi:hypothetical protein